MARRYIYSIQTGPSLDGKNKLYFRTVTTYVLDSSGKPTNPVTYVYYTAKPNGMADDGSVWVPGNSEGQGFKQGGYVLAATTNDKGVSFDTYPYTQEDVNAGRLPPTKRPQDPILAKETIRSLNTRGGKINTAIQDSIINTAVNVQPGLAGQLAAKQQNTASEAPAADPIGGNPQTPPGEPSPPPPAPEPSSGPILEGNAPDIKQKISITSGEPNNMLKYPLKMSENHDIVRFQAVEIEPRKFSSGPATFGFTVGKPTYKKPSNGDGPIYLGIQSPISDQNSVEWGPDNLSAIDAFTFSVANKAITGGIEAAGAAAAAALQQIITTADANTQRINRLLAGKAANINNILPRTDNVVLNPNLELLFQAPQLRPFTFTFKMSARDDGEAKVIKKIIKYFKYYMAARIEDDQLFLRAPYVFIIDYLYRTVDAKGNKIIKIHPGINKISGSGSEDGSNLQKACALTNCSVDYTPLGSYMTYPDGTMVSYSLNLQFQEIEPVYDRDYDDHPIGF